MNKNIKILFGLFVFSLLLVSACNNNNSTTTGGDLGGPPLPPGANIGGDVVTGKTVEISMVAKKFEFIPNTIKVNQGDKLRIKITSTDTTHGFFLPDFGINEQVTPGKETVVEFVAKTKGTYTFRCSVPCGEGHSAMSGTLTVE